MKVILEKKEATELLMAALPQLVPGFEIKNVEWNEYRTTVEIELERKEPPPLVHQPVEWQTDPPV